MKLHDLTNTTSRATRKRVGRGDGSGIGKTSGRGENGARKRSGYSRRPGFEGGQLPLIRRLPKRGFKNPNREEVTVVNIGAIDKNCGEGEEVTRELLQAKGVIGKKTTPILKILGDGDLNKALTIKADKFSASAKEKIESAGGKPITL